MLIMVLAIALVIINRKGKVDFADQIKLKNDSIEVLANQNQILQIQFERSEDLFIQTENEIVLYQDSLKFIKKRNSFLKRNYEWKIANIMAIPTDTLYRDLSEWLDSRD